MSSSRLLPAARPQLPDEPRHARTGPTRPGALGRLAGLAFAHRGWVVVSWIAALALVVGLSTAFAGEFDADYTAPGSDSKIAQDLLADRFPAVSGETADLVVRAEQGVDDPAVRAAVDAAVGEMARVEHVRSVEDPYAVPGAISPDGRTLLARVQLDVVIAEDMPLAATEALIAAGEGVEATAGDGVQVAMGGQVVGIAEQGEIGSEGIGLAAAAVILLITFGSVVAAGLPILVAMLGLGISGMLVGLIAAVTDVPDWSTSLAAMMGIGVGIDYVLLLLTRYREFLAEGKTPRDATVAMADTAGRSVLVAGATVVISMLGLSAMGLSFMTGAALATIAAVIVVVLAAMTLLPALLGVVGARIDRLRVPLPRRARSVEDRPSGWIRWSRLVQRRPWLAAGLGVAVLAVLASPYTAVRYGFPDASNDAPTLSTRQAYDLVSDGFGPGANGPLLIAAQLPGDGSTTVVQRLREAVQDTAGVAGTSPVQVNPAGDTAIISVTPASGPQTSQTEDLVQRLRDDVVPAVAGATDTDVYVGGLTAGAIDTTENIASRLPALIGGVVGLSFLLLVLVFRSLAVAVKAAVLNLLSLGAAYGVVAFALQGGWFGQLFGIETATPLPAFIPVLMFAILFGLSMDYEVFLLARIRERWLATGNASESVVDGLASTARVITAAAAIMVAVFAAFIPSEQVFLKVIGIGLATAIFVDATVVRMLLVPAIMQLMGRATWWLPRWLDRLLPHVHVEGPVSLTAHPEDRPQRELVG